LKNEKSCLFCLSKYCEYCIADRMNNTSSLCIQCGCEFIADRYIYNCENLILLLQFNDVEIKCMNYKNEFGGCEYSIKLDN
jgi:hypothetical protein